MIVEAMKQALSALELSDKLINGDEHHMGLDGAMDGYYSGCFDIDGTSKRTNEAITALRQAIEQVEKQKPVAYMDIVGSLYHTWAYDEDIPLYLHPVLPKHEWVGLTDNEIIQMYCEPRSDREMIEFAREFEAKLKEKNHG